VVKIQKTKVQLPPGAVKVKIPESIPVTFPQALFQVTGLIPKRFPGRKIKNPQCWEYHIIKKGPYQRPKLCERVSLEKKRPFSAENQITVDAPFSGADEFIPTPPAENQVDLLFFRELKYLLL